MQGSPAAMALNTHTSRPCRWASGCSSTAVAISDALASISKSESCTADIISVPRYLHPAVRPELDAVSTQDTEEGSPRVLCRAGQLPARRLLQSVLEATRHSEDDAVRVAGDRR